MKVVVILGSGEGTNFSAIVNRARSKKWNVKLFAISNVPGSNFVRRAKEAGIDCKPIDGSSGNEYLNEVLLSTLKDLKPSLVILAGYMKILPSKIVKEFENKIINIHPSLLPSFKGAHAIRDSMDYGVKWTGVTIHIVNEEVDAGPILAQTVVPILNDDTIKTLTERIHRAEHKMYPLVIEKILGGERFEGAFECQQ